MSWSFSVTNVTPHTVTGQLQLVAHRDVIPGLEGASAFEAAAQIEQAILSAEVLVKSGAFGDGPFTVNLTGHANPDHKYRAGWQRDYCTIWIQQLALAPGGTS